MLSMTGGNERIFLSIYLSFNSIILHCREKVMFKPVVKFRDHDNIKCRTAMASTLYTFRMCS